MTRRALAVGAAFAALAHEGCSPEDRGASPGEIASDSGTAGASGPESGASNDGGESGDVGAELVAYGCVANAIGTVGAVFRGVPAYCQPPGANGFYQCDELGNRFLRDALQHPDLDNVVTELASAMCDHAAAMSAYSVWGPRYRDPSGSSPVPGDLVVFEGEYQGSIAHVAVITGWTSQKTVGVMQQNLGAGGSTAPTGSLGWNAGASFFAEPTAICWIHAEPSAAAAPTGPSCGCFDGDGDYCGLAILDHQSWYGCVADVKGAPLGYGALYACKGGQFSLESACDDCVTQLDHPAFGYCAVQDPCGHVSSAASGPYCGASTANGFRGGAAGTLYGCTGGKVASAKVCPNGCGAAGPSGVDGCR